MMNILISYYQYDNLMVMLYDISDIHERTKSVQNLIQFFGNEI